MFQEIWNWTLQQARANKTSLDDLSHNYGTPIVAETADWWLNDVYKSALTGESVQLAFANVLSQEEVQEGQFGGGAGMTCHMFPGGTGTSSRLVQGSEGREYTVGILVQTNYGHDYDLQIAGVPVGKLLLKEKSNEEEKSKYPHGGKADEGSIVIILM